MHDKAIIVLTIGRECEGVLVLVLQDERIWKDFLGRELDIENMEGVKFSVADTKIDGDKATVTVKMEGGKKDKDGKAGKEEEKFDLKKVDGKWKIDFNKEDSTKGKKGTNAA